MVGTQCQTLPLRSLLQFRYSIFVTSYTLKSQKAGSVCKPMNLSVKKTTFHYSSQLLLAFFSIPVGAAIGTIDAIFGRVLLWITDLRNLYFFPLVLFLPIGGIVIAYCYLHFGGKAAKG